MMECVFYQKLINVLCGLRKKMMERTNVATVVKVNLSPINQNLRTGKIARVLDSSS